MEAESRGREAEAQTRQPAGKRETTMAVAKEKVMAMATENASPPPSRDLVNAHLGPQALAALKAVTAAALVLAAEAATALKADDANDGDGGVAVAVACLSRRGAG